MHNQAIPYSRTTLICLILVIATPILGHSQTREKAPADDQFRVSLFNERDLYGWKAENRDADWRVEDREIRVSQGSVGLLRTTSQFDNFILELDFWVTPDSNSGVFVRTSPNPKAPGVDCYEVNLAPNNPFPTGSLVDQAKTDQPFAPNQWHHLKIVAIEQCVRALINGKETSRSVQGPRGRGYIGLQKNKGEARFRNVSLQPLDLQQLDESAWSKNGLGAATANWEQQTLKLRGGSGQYSTKESYGDFVFFTKFKTGPATNSGVFFRCIPNDKMMGYESQIQNSEPDGKKLDWPTGSIFRRQSARHHSAPDEKWGEMMIVTTGPHVSVWVNGELVTDWTDRRKPNVNPRRGLRLAPGTIMLQGHDPKTQIDFRNLRVRELGQRKRG